MRSIAAINPFRCRMWGHHDRLDSYITEQSCKAEIASFEAHGQVVPALGRPLRGDSEHDVELIYGARRLFVARHLNRKLLVELRELSDQEAVVAMDIENRQRADISPYERGVSYASWLRANFFRSQDELAHALKISSSQVSRLIKLTRIPPVVVQAFRSPAELCEAWGLELVGLLEDTQRRDLVIRRARAIAALSSRPTAEEVFQQLVAEPGQSRARRPARRDEVVKDAQGVPLFRIRYQMNAVVIVLPLETGSVESMAQIKAAFTRLLRPAEITPATATRGPGPENDRRPGARALGPSARLSPVVNGA
jgi:ParB/RepB/Spo0J family partition protein